MGNHRCQVTVDMQVKTAGPHLGQRAQHRDLSLPAVEAQRALVDLIPPPGLVCVCCGKLLCVLWGQQVAVHAKRALVDLIPPPGACVLRALCERVPSQLTRW